MIPKQGREDERQKIIPSISMKSVTTCRLWRLFLKLGRFARSHSSVRPFGNEPGIVRCHSNALHATLFPSVAVLAEDWSTIELQSQMNVAWHPTTLFNPFHQCRCSADCSTMSCSPALSLLLLLIFGSGLAVFHSTFNFWNSGVWGHAFHTLPAPQRRWLIDWLIDWFF
jgi:hypothetical protein